MSLETSPLVAQWLQTDGRKVMLFSGKVDIGQRISTALAQIVAEELTLSVEEIEIAPVRTGVSPDEGVTSGSNSVAHSGRALRLACATLRAYLHRQLTAREGTGDWQLRDGWFQRNGGNVGHRLIAVMAQTDFSSLKVNPDADVLPACPEMPSPAMRGLPDMVAGRFIYVHDIEVPDMLHARVIRPPHARARLRGVDEAVLKGVKNSGIRVIRDGTFLAVAGPGEWRVERATLRLGAGCDWDLGGGLPEEDVFAQLVRSQATHRLTVVAGTPRPDLAIPQDLPDADYSARFERPYLMHGALAPSAAFARWEAERLNITCHSQGIYPLRDSIADSLNMSREAVTITHMPGSGCYGHNGADDAAFDAALVARALPGASVLLKWRREDEHAWEPYAPAMAVELSAKLAPDARIASYSAEVFSDTHRGRPREGAHRAGPARLLANQWRDCDVPAPVAVPNMNAHGGMHRNLDPIYTFAKRRLVKNLVSDMPHRTSALRCLGAAANIFALESMMDELAQAAGEDPIAYRKRHLDDARGLAVLERLQELTAARPVSGGMGGRGIAYAQYKNTMTRVGVCVDIDLSDAGEILLRDAVIVADAGRVLDRAGLCAQLEGGFIQGASWALCEALEWDRDGIRSRDWARYPVLRFDRIPKITIDLIAAQQAPALGAGEAAPSPAIAAIGNALNDATGLRIRRLPLTAEAIRHQGLMQ